MPCPTCGGALDPEPHPHCPPCVWRDMQRGVAWCERADEQHACSLPAGHQRACRCFCGEALPGGDSRDQQLRPPVTSTSCSGSADPAADAARRRQASIDAWFEGQWRRLRGLGGVCGGLRRSLSVRGG